VNPRQGCAPRPASGTSKRALRLFLTSHDAGYVRGGWRAVVVINHGRVVLWNQISFRRLRRNNFGPRVLQRAVFFSQSPPQAFQPCQESATPSKASELRGSSWRSDTRCTPERAGFMSAGAARPGPLPTSRFDDPPFWKRDRTYLWPKLKNEIL